MFEEAVASLEALVRGDLDAVIFGGGDFYVQFAQGAAGELLAEAVGDDYLRERLTPDQLRLLHDLGFRPPAARDAGNHAFKIPAAPKGAAALAIQVLNTVYGIATEDITITEG